MMAIFDEIAGVCKANLSDQLAGIRDSLGSIDFQHVTNSALGGFSSNVPSGLGVEVAALPKAESIVGGIVEAKVGRITGLEPYAIAPERLGQFCGLALGGFKSPSVMSMAA